MEMTGKRTLQNRTLLGVILMTVGLINFFEAQSLIKKG